MDGRFVSYLRVSTDKQGKTGLGIEAQREAIVRYLNGGNWTLLAEYVEVESGKKNNRPQFEAAKAYAKRMKATLLIAKLDRLSRSVHFISGLMEKNVAFVACDMPNASEFELHIRASLAHEERKLISLRTKAALSVAKTNGIKLGGVSKASGINHAAEARSANADAFAETIGPMIQTMRDNGLTLRQIAAKLTADGIKTARGKEWTAMAVSNILSRIVR